MITTKDLEGIASASIPYGEAETVSVTKRTDIPPEFQEKNNGHKFEQPQVYIVEGVELAGPVGVGFKDGDIILDTAYGGRIDIMERNRPYFTWALDVRRNHQPTRIKRAVSLTCVWASNYFHWFLEILPKLEGIIKFIEQDEKPVTLLVEHNVPAFAIQSLQRIGFAKEDITVIEQPLYYHVDELLISTPRRGNGFTSPGGVRWVREILSERHLELPEEWFKQLYVSRKHANIRRVVNEDELINLLLKHGFTTVHPERFDLKNQIKMFNQAWCVISPHGAGLTNAIHAPDPCIIELGTPEYVNPCYYLLAEGMGWDYHYLPCEPVGVEDLKVDYRKLKGVLESL